MSAANTYGALTHDPAAHGEGAGAGHFVVEAMKEEDYEQCLEMTVDSFLRNNAVVMHLRVPEEEVRAYLQYATRASLAQGLSIVVRDTQNSQLAGFLFNSQFNVFEEDPAGFPTLRPLLEGIGKLYDDAIFSMGIGSLLTGKSLRVAAGATADSYQRMGVGKLLRCSMLKYAEDRGFERVISEPAHPATVHIWTVNAGYRVAGRMRLSEYRDRHGERPFQGCESEVAIVEGVTRHGGRKCKNSSAFICCLLAAVACKCKCWFQPYTAAGGV